MCWKKQKQNTFKWVSIKTLVFIKEQPKLLNSPVQTKSSFCLKALATPTVPQTPIKSFLAALVTSRAATSPCVIAGLKSDPDAPPCKKLSNKLPAVSCWTAAPSSWVPDGGCDVTWLPDRIQQKRILLVLLVLLYTHVVCWCCWYLSVSYFNETFWPRRDLVTGGSCCCWRSFQHCLCKARLPFFCTFLFVFSLCRDSGPLL